MNPCFKETLYNKNNNYGPNTMAGMAKLVMRGEINLTDIDSILPENTKKISKDLQLKISGKSNAMLVEEIKHIARMYVAGQGM